MKRFTTYTQHKTLEDYWQDHIPFTVSSLIERGIFHFPALGRQTLRLMESRGQIIKQYKWNGEALCVATTESKEEWKKIWRPNRLFLEACCGPSRKIVRMNWYERQALCEELEETLMELQWQAAVSKS